MNTLAVQSAKRSVQGLLGLIGSITTLAGIASASLVAALNTVGVLGIGVLGIGAAAWGAGGQVGGEADELPAKVKRTCWAAGITAVICAFLYFVLGSGLDKSESKFNVLTVIGIVTILALAALVMLGWDLFMKGTVHPRKKCPECANEVLAAARKCQYCGYRFVPPQSQTPSR